jgi:hypothetical protein
MSVSGISSNNLLFELLGAQNTQSPGTQSQNKALQQIEDDFTQLSQDLPSGNLTQAQQDFAPLSKALSSSQATPSSTSASSANPVQQAFSALQQDLQKGDLSAAQKDFATLQQTLQQVGSQHHHHHHNADSQQASAVEQDFNSLAQALQSGNLSNAQTAFASLQQDLQQFSPNNSSNSSPTSVTGQSSSSTLNVTA